MKAYEHLSDQQMADEIATWAGRIAAGEARLLALVAEFDRREAWAGPGLLSCAHWLSWRLGMGLKAAHERVRVARALAALPRTAETFGQGQLSWTQVRAITRVATADDEQTYVEVARHATGAQLEKLVRGVRRARKIVADEVDPELAAHRMRTRVGYDEDGTLVVTMRLRAEDGAVVLAALEQARGELDNERRDANVPESSAPDAAETVPATAPSRQATLAEGMVHLAGSYLAAQRVARPAAARRGRARLVAQVDPLSGWGRLADGELLPPTSLRAVLRCLPGRSRLRPLLAADLSREDLGRSQRLPSPALRELLGAVDGERWRFPGCSRRRKLHAHHVVFWSDGGPTNLANLALLCSRHHTRVHAEGFALTLQPDRTLTVTTAAGLPVSPLPSLPWRPAAELELDIPAVSASTLPPVTAGDRLDLSYAVAVLLQHAA